MCKWQVHISAFHFYCCKQRLGNKFYACIRVYFWDFFDLQRYFVFPPTGNETRVKSWKELYCRCWRDTFPIFGAGTSVEAILLLVTCEEPAYSYCVINIGGNTEKENRSNKVFILWGVTFQLTVLFSLQTPTAVKKVKELVEKKDDCVRLHCYRNCKNCLISNC